MSYLQSLAEAVSGPVLAPGEPGYAEELAPFNLAVTHTPDVVVGAVDADDVAVAVRWAAERGLPVGVQATGHGATTPYTRGVVISTRRMQHLTIDPARRVARIGAGVRWRTVIDAAAPHGLAPLNGSSSDVGVIGYTLGGGMPVLGRTFGFASDWVRSFEVVTAEGVVRHVSADSEPDLFYALRGGKPAVGIVTEVQAELVPVAEVFGGAVFVDGSHAAAMLAAYRSWTATLPDTMTTALKFLRLPPLPDVPEPLRSRFTVQLAVAHVGDPREGERLVAPMRAVAPAIIDELRVMAYPEIDSVHHDPTHPVPVRERSGLFGELTDEAAAELVAAVGPEAQLPLLMVELRHLGGAMARRVEDAVGPRDAAYSLLLLGVLAPEIAAIVPEALAATERRLARHLNGRTFANMHGVATSAEDLARPWPDAVGRRLAAITVGADPGHVFRFGHTVPEPALLRE